MAKSIKKCPIHKKYKAIHPPRYGKVHGWCQDCSKQYAETQIESEKIEVQQLKILKKLSTSIRFKSDQQDTDMNNLNELMELEDLRKSLFK